MEKCLTFSPKRRIDVNEALAHPYLAVGSPLLSPWLPAFFASRLSDILWLQPYHDPLDEPTAPALDPSFFDFDNGAQLDKEQLKGVQFLVPHSVR